MKGFQKVQFIPCDMLIMTTAEYASVTLLDEMRSRNCSAGAVEMVIPFFFTSVSISSRTV